MRKGLLRFELGVDPAFVFSKGNRSNIEACKEHFNQSVLQLPTDTTTNPTIYLILHNFTFYKGKNLAFFVGSYGQNLGEAKAFI